MNSEHNHIDINLLKRYYDGAMSGAEKNALEQMALDDPFLRDAMEGFEANPGSFEKYYQDQIIRHQKFGYGYLMAGGILTVGLVVMLVIFKGSAPTEDVAITMSPDTTQITQEIDVIPDEIDTLTVVAQEELIVANEIVQNKTGIQKTIQYPVVSTGDRPIVIEEDVMVDEEDKILPENQNYNLVEYVPATYLADLFVVDYRRIQRDKRLITYTGYEFTGTSARFENEQSEKNADLVEKQIDVPYFEYLGTAMINFSKGDYKKALNNYLIILDQYSDDINALFYGGLCYHNLGKHEKAIAFFDQVLTHELNAFREEAAWYKVKQLLKLGRKTEAVTLLDNIIAGGGFYVKEAIALKKTL